MSKLGKQIELVIKNGQIKSIYDDELTVLCALGDVRIKRASHVEPSASGCGWYADLRPVNGPILRGFTTRKAALDAEVKYLKEHVVI